MLAVKSPQGTLELPAYVSPTLHPGAVAIPLGHRYTAYQHPRYVAGDPRSLNPTAILPAATDATSGALAFMSVKVTLAKLGTRRPLAVLQATHDQDERELAQHVDLRAAREQALRGKAPHEPAISMYADKQYPGPRWGMTIDVDACVGCQACVVACQAENNVPVVGKASAAYGRQLHWLRAGALGGRQAGASDESLPADALPALRDRAVRAGLPRVRGLSHRRGPERTGLQPVRRARATAATTARTTCGGSTGSSTSSRRRSSVQLNPDVTVRQLGVMEKCTMCVQRIVAGKDRARDEKRGVRGRRHRHRLPADVPDPGHHVRQPEGRGEATRPSSPIRRGPTTSSKRSDTRPSVTYLQEGRPRSTREPMSDRHSAPTFADVNRDVLRTLEPPGNLYFAWMCVVASSSPAGFFWPGPARSGRAWAWPASACPDVGDVHHHLRVLDRYRPRRHADLGDPLPLPRALAHVDLPRRRGHDDLRGHDGRSVPAHPRRTHVVRVLPPAVPEPALPLAELPVAAGLGRVRDLDVPHDQHGRSSSSGSSPTSPPCATPPPAGAAASTRCCRSAGRARPPVAALPARLRSPGRAGHAAGALGPQRGVRGTSRWRSFPAGTRRSSRRSSSTAPSSRASRWCWCWACRCVTSSTCTRYIQEKHLDAMGKLILVTGLVLTYFYLCEIFTSLLQRRAHREGLALLEGDRELRVGALAHVLLQLRGAPRALLAARADQPGRPVRRVHPGADRHVVRALQHHRPVARPRLLSVHVGHLLPDARPTR